MSSYFYIGGWRRDGTTRRQPPLAVPSASAPADQCRPSGWRSLAPAGGSTYDPATAASGLAPVPRSGSQAPPLGSLRARRPGWGLSNRLPIATDSNPVCNRRGGGQLAELSTGLLPLFFKTTPFSSDPSGSPSGAMTGRGSSLPRHRPGSQKGGIKPARMGRGRGRLRPLLQHGRQHEPLNRLNPDPAERGIFFACTLASCNCM